LFIKGFNILNNSLINIDNGINTVNKKLNILGNITAQGFDTLNKTMKRKYRI